jgi:lysozyme
MPNPTRTSSHGVQFIAGWEGWSPIPYNDPADNATIGYGHLLHLGPVTKADRAKWGTITRERGTELLAGDLHTAEVAVSRMVHPPFGWQRRYDAIVSFVYNVGAGNFEGSHLLELLNTGRLRRGVGAELLKWDHAGGKVLPGLLARRKAERALGRFWL